MEHIDRQSSTKGPAEWFSGDVWLDPIAQGIAHVHFTPGARTAWHSHSAGQTLYVIDGRGRVQSRGEDVVVIRPGDIVRAAADEEHWHGADEDHGMSHLSITGDGSPTWGEHVED